jgi:tRNA threonylcarbamoyladenosine modification (KEOPS) complex  Pcc1 subunit
MVHHDEPRDYNVSSKVSLQQEGRDEVTLQVAGGDNGALRANLMNFPCANPTRSYLSS